MNYKKALIYSAVAVVIVFLFQTQIFYIKFNDGLKVTEITALLMSFSIIAMLIERLLDKGPLESGYSMLKQERNGTLSIKQQVDVEEYKKTFNWAAFVGGVIIASLGFKFFINISEPVCPSFADAGCNSKEGNESFVFFKNYIYPLVDIFLTGILLSGGAHFIREIILQIKEILPNKKTDSESETDPIQKTD